MKKYIKRLAIICALLPAYSFGANWEVVTQGGNMIVSVDTESLVRLKGGHRKAWVEYMLITPEKSIDGKPFSRILNLYIINCSERTTATERELLYDSITEGTVVKENVFQRSNLKFSEPVPESFGENILNFVCKAIPVKK